MTTEQPGASPALSDQLGPLPKREGLSMTERELLTRAAEAAGLRIEYWAQEDYPVVGVGEAQHGWNPLKFNSDALALAVRMEMDVFVRAGRWTEAVAPMGEPYKAMHGVHGDAETATRFAITMAALGKPTEARTVMARWLTDEQAAETDADGVGLEGGWYECINNWDDYTEVAIHEGDPSYWMPLPAPPVSA